MRLSFSSHPPSPSASSASAPALSAPRRFLSARARVALLGCAAAGGVGVLWLPGVAQGPAIVPDNEAPFVAPLPAMAASASPWRPSVLPGLPTVEDRIAAVCEWFDIEPPALAPGEDVLTSEAGLDWMIASGVSIDWLALGEVKGLVIAFRNEELQRRASLSANAA